MKTDPHLLVRTLYFRVEYSQICKCSNTLVNREFNFSTVFSIPLFASQSNSDFPHSHNQMYTLLSKWKWTLLKVKN